MLRLRMRLCGEILAALLRECTLEGLNAKGVERRELRERRGPQAAILTKEAELGCRARERDCRQMENVRVMEV
jgi:hypothetical protein